MAFSIFCTQPPMGLILVGLPGPIGTHGMAVRPELHKSPHMRPLRFVSCGIAAACEDDVFFDNGLTGDEPPSAKESSHS